MSKIWFSSDFHLNHQNIAGKSVSKWDKGYRDFDSVYQMNETIIRNINDNVKYDDILYFLGDFCFGGHKLTSNWRERIHCQTIHFIKGNHDNHIDDYKLYFSSLNDVLKVKHGKHEFFLSHYSHRVWEASHKGAIHLYGHSHDNLDRTGQYWGKSMDVGIDSAYRITGEYRPFMIEEIVDIMSRRETKLVDHHNSQTDR